MPVLSLSNYFLLNKAEYFDRISSVQLVGDYVQWVKFFVKGIISETDYSINAITSYIKMKQNNIGQIMKCGKQSKNLLALFEYVEKNHMLEIRDAAKALSLSFSTISSAARELERMKIIKSVNEQARNRVFNYEGYLQILN